MTGEYDYIIVGAGSSGCVMAYRLSADPKVSVLLIEAGPKDRHAVIHMPKGVGKAMALPDATFPYPTEMQPDTGGREEYWTRGKTLGGSSAINGMMYVRGQPADFDELERQAGPDWSWTKIGAAYRALEKHELGAAETRGDAGLLHVTMPRERTVMTEALVEAGVSLGLPRKEDVNQPDNGAGIGYAPCTVFRGRRESAATAFLHPIRGRANLRIETGVTVDRLSFSGNRRVTGLTGHRDGRPVAYQVRREVILAAGALASPAILMRSGVGPAAELAKNGIEVIHDSPNVGRNLREHRALVLQWRTPDHLSVNRDHRGARLVANVARYYLTHGGIMAAATYEIAAWFKTRPELERPDAQLLIAPYSLDFNSPKLDLEPKGGIQICAYVLRPESAGSIELRSADPNDEPIIRPNYRGEAEDRRKMIDVIRFARDYVRQPSLRDKVSEEIRPGEDYRSDEEILDAYDRFGNGAYHASGSCRMGLDTASVVDEALRVRGVDGVRVIDTSIQPFILAGNTQAPAMAMAWRAADMILEGP